MPIAVIADVHSNLPALEAVLEETKNMEVFSVGDVVGYYPFPNETIELLRNRGVKGVMGNHDFAVLKGSMGWFNADAKFALKWTAEALTPENRTYLGSLPKGFEGEWFKALHGSPDDPLFEYVFPETPLEKLASYLEGPKPLILAHTHQPFVKPVGRGLIFNPGSVGQPRDGDTRASYAVYNPISGKVEIKRVKYAIDKVAGEMERQGLPAGLAERLYEGV